MDTVFHNTLGPTAWIVMGLIPPAILALYFLKLRRQPLEVPSTYLWSKAIEDLHVNSIWQRLRQSLLLLLQLLIVALAILALLRPGWQGESLAGSRFIFLVDRSASMSATDVNGDSRLEAAKRRVSDFIEQLESDMTAMIIAFDDQPDVAQEFTSNQRMLRDAVQRIEPSAKSTNIRGALELAASFAMEPYREDADETSPQQQREPTQLYILSDGRFRAVEDLSLDDFQAKFLPIGTLDADNLAITAFNARRNENRPEERQAFVQVANFSDDTQQPQVELLLDGRLIDAAELEIAPGSSSGAIFDLGDAADGELTARLTPPAAFDDRLAVDNVAYAVLEQPRQARVLLATPGNRALELGLSTGRVQRFANVEKIAPEKLASQETELQLASQVYDLVIYDQCAPEQMPRANTLFIGQLPPLPAWNEKVPATRVERPQIIDWQRSHPLLNLVELGNVAVADSLLVQPPTGGKVLIDSTEGPLLAIAPRDSYEDAVLGFSIVDAAGEPHTNWPRRHSFPNFCLNVVQYLAADNESQVDGVRPGQAVELELPDRDVASATLTLPDGTKQRVSATPQGRLSVYQTDQLGVYEVQSATGPPRRFAVNLFDREESTIRLKPSEESAGNAEVIDSLEIGFEDVTAESTAAPIRQELWTALLLAVLAALVFEWYIYNRRVYI
jgi:hypothetical protein